MQYITDTLGIKVDIEPWEGADKLPYYLIDRYEFKKVFLDGIACLFMNPKGEPDTLITIKKHMAKVREAEPLPIVLELSSMNARRRKSLIEARIPFVSPENQIYLPFLGIFLNERYTSVKTPSETLMPSSQLLFFYFLCKDGPELHTSETVDVLGFSAMQISRAIKQLTALNLVSSRKDGVRIVISSQEKRSELFERAKHNLLNPVQKRIYVERNELPGELPFAGYSALSELTMLGGSQIETFAFFGKSSDLTGTDKLVDYAEQVEVEIWRYDPLLLSRYSGIIDTLSLVASLITDDDERVEQSVDELLKTLWG